MGIELLKLTRIRQIITLNQSTDETVKLRATCEQVWPRLVAKFRQLGGIAQNIQCLPCEHGLGLFVVDPSKPIRIELPEQLLIQVDQVKLRKGYLDIGSEQNIPANYRNWFLEYQQHFGWIAKTYQEIDSFERALRGLPPPALRQLESMGLLNLRHRHRGNWANVIFRQYLQTRSLIYNGRRVLMPIAELVNHSPLADRYQISGGVKITGHYQNEVVICYNESDPLSRFFNHGFASPESLAYSYPPVMSMDRGERRKSFPSVREKSASVGPILDLPSHEPPKHHRIEAVYLEQLNANNRHQYTQNDFSDLYDDVLTINQHQLNTLLDKLSPCKSACANALRQAIDWQLDALEKRVQIIVR